MRVHFFNINTFWIKYKIKKAYNYLLKNLQIDSQHLAVNVGYVSDDAMQKLNQEYRQVDKVTDVLSFPMIDLQIGTWLTQEIYEHEKHPQTKIVELGDVIICERVAKMQAEKFGHSFLREVCFLAVHGFLHVLGFDHTTKEEEQNMNELTNKILKKVRISK